MDKRNIRKFHLKIIIAGAMKDNSMSFNCQNNENNFIASYITVSFKKSKTDSRWYHINILKVSSFSFSSLAHAKD